VCCGAPGCTLHPPSLCGVRTGREPGGALEREIGDPSVEDKRIREYIMTFFGTVPKVIQFK
jgi:hypothetical protein